MAVTLNASTSAGLINTADTSGILQLQTANTTALTIDASQNVGVGATPSASPSGSFFVKRNICGATTTPFVLYANSTLNASETADIYINTGFASRYYQYNGAHFWATAPSGTAGNAITFTQAMTLDASGRLGIGQTSPSARLEVLGSSSTGYLTVGDGTSTMLMGAGSALSSDSAVPYLRSNGAIGFATGGGTERARIDSGGSFLVGTTSNISYKQVLQFSGDGINGFRITNTATSGGPDAFNIAYTGYSPNNTTNAINFGDSTTVRFQVKTNGGIYNYSANNSNLSDRREKTNFSPAGDYLAKICAIPVQTYNYIDQNLEEDDGLTLGVVAQDVQAVAPELVVESDWSEEKDGSKMRLSIYQTDMQYALMKCIQEQQALITQLQADVAALKGA